MSRVNKKTLFNEESMSRVNKKMLLKEEEKRMMENIKNSDIVINENTLQTHQKGVLKFDVFLNEEFVLEENQVTSVSTNIVVINVENFLLMFRADPKFSQFSRQVPHIPTPEFFIKGGRIGRLHVDMTNFSPYPQNIPSKSVIIGQVLAWPYSEEEYLRTPSTFSW